MLQEKQRIQLTKQILLFSSSFEGEQISALNAANKTLRKNNSSWHEVVEALNGGNPDAFDRGLDAGYSAGFKAGCNQKKLDHHQMLSELKSQENVLNEWSKSFIDNLHNNKNWRLTEKQCAVIERLYRQFCG